MTWFNFLNLRTPLSSNIKARKHGREAKTPLAAAQMANSWEMQKLWPGYGLSEDGIFLQQKQILLQQTDMSGRVLDWNTFHGHCQLFPRTHNSLDTDKCSAAPTSLPLTSSRKSYGTTPIFRCQSRPLFNSSLEELTCTTSQVSNIFSSKTVIRCNVK